MADNLLLMQIAYVTGFLFLSVLAYIYLKKAKIPYTIGLVIIGIFLGYLAKHTSFVNDIKDFQLTPDIILYLIVPALIFSAALGMKLNRFLSRLTPILILAIPGLIIGTLITGYLVGTFTSLTMGAAMIFGALISATDPVAVVAIFKEQKAPEDLAILVDGESLLNDGTSMVMFSVVCTVVLSGKAIGIATLSAATLQFCYIFFGGIAIGILTTLVLFYLTFQGRKSPTVQTVISLIIAYVSFIAAEKIGVSGVMSTVAAAVAYRYLYTGKKDTDMHIHIDYFWDFVTFIANSSIFLLLGLSEEFLYEEFSLYKKILPALAIVIAAVLIARVVVVFGGSFVNNKLCKNKISMANQIVMHWGGLRGALPLAMALSLTNEQVGDENRMIIVLFTLVIILFTLVVEGITIKPLMKKLKII
jgi:CPA1 family monovalent cation:H+ antiporter